MKENTFGLSRRLFIGGVSVATVASLYVAAVGRGALKACNYEDVQIGLLSDFQSLIRIGNSYLNGHTNAALNSADELFLSETESSPASIVSAVQRRLLAMEYRLRDEFARSETVICDGWVLAKSEAQLCALIAAHFRRLEFGS
jgi:hypothetical protein